MQLLAVTPIKFEWQKLRHEYLGPGFSSIYPHWENKFKKKQNTENKIRFAILRRRRFYDIGIFLIIRFKTHWRWFGWIVTKEAKIENKKYVVWWSKIGNISLFLDFVLGKGFKQGKIPIIACHVPLSIGMER